MSALTDLFTSLANKIRSKLGTTSAYTPAQAIAAIDNVYNKGVTDTKKGNAAVGDVLASKTFTSNTAGVNKTGTIPSKAATIYNTSTTDQTISSGQYLSGKQTIRKVVTSGNITAGNIKTGVTVQVGDEGNGSRIVSATGTFTKSGTQSSGQTVAATEQILSGYSAWVNGAEVKGNIPSRDPRSTYPAVQTGHNGTGSYVYIPYGYYQPNETVNNAKSTWFYLTDAQAQNMHRHTATWTPSTSKYNSAKAEIAEFHSYRYVNTAVCYSAGQNAVSNADTYLYVTNGPTTMVSEYMKRGNAKGIYLKGDTALQGLPTVDILEWGTWKVLASYTIGTNMPKSNGYYYAVYSSPTIGLVRIQFKVAAAQAIWYHFTY